MNGDKGVIKAFKADLVIVVLAIGAVWGIFEATAGYLLHLLPVRIGFLVWYPVAVFFLTNAYRATGSRAAVLATALLAACVKLLNLMLPGRIDSVLNPAVSIVFEGIAVCLALPILDSASCEQNKRRLFGASLGMNTLWRLLYIGYLALIVPLWMREASILQSYEKTLRFIVTDNFCSSVVVWIGCLIGERLPNRDFKLTGAKAGPGALPMAAGAGALLIISAALQAVL